MAPRLTLPAVVHRHPTSADAMPIIDSHQRYRGLIIATGFSGHGFGIGPGAGEAVAELVVDGRSKTDLQAFRLSRFFDGSPIRPGPSI